ncbi:TPA: hypothetical protein ACPJZQ_004899 [Vibrio alginolyticus]
MANESVINVLLCSLPVSTRHYRQSLIHYLTFGVADYFTELFRLSMVFELSYWNGLVDEQMAQKLAMFVNVPLQSQ